MLILFENNYDTNINLNYYILVNLVKIKLKRFSFLCYYVFMVFFILYRIDICVEISCKNTCFNLLLNIILYE